MDKVLLEIQKTELTILDTVDQFCKNNKIEYSLSYGTLIGAVRHKGFIPWDDDIDLMMRRDEYERFIRAWNNNPPEGYFLQTDMTDPKYGNNFLKIRKNNTTFIQSEKEKTCGYHTGIFIDIFPVDRVAPKGLSRKIQYRFCQISMLMTRNHKSRKKGLSGIVETILLSLPSSLKIMLKNYSYKQKTKWNNSDINGLPFFWNGTMHGAITYFQPDLFDSYIELPFEGHYYKAFKCYDSFLKGYFGDYMQLPPENKRVSHHPIVVDFKKEYNELLNKENNKHA